MTLGKLLLVVGLAATIAVSGCMDAGSNKSPSKSPSSKKTSSIQLSVGEDAWETPAEINITKEVSPSKVRLGPEETILWRNRNNFSVNISIQKVENKFTLSPKGTHIFKPSSSFEYEVNSRDRYLGSGEVILD